MAEIVVLIFAGTLNGAVAGLTGGNGMAALLSVLLLAGYRVHDVVGLCLATQVFTMVAAFVPAARIEGIAWGVTVLLCLPAAALAYVGASVSLAVSPGVLTTVVVAVLALIGVSLLCRRSEPVEAAPAAQALEMGALSYVLVGITGAVSGFVAGLVGGGANILVAQALHRLLGFRFRRAVAMSVCLGIVSAILGVAPYVSAGRVQMSAAPAIIVPALVTAWLVGGAAARLDARRIQQGQGLYLLLTAIVISARKLW